MSTGCYWPNGDEVAPDLNYSPCPANPIAGRDTTHVTCCDNNAVCTDQGLCVGTANLYYRGACTDKTWASSACASECVATKANDNFDQGGFTNVLPCANGTGDIQWCCDQGSTGCCNSASNMLLGRLYAWPVDHVGDTSASASSTSLSTSTLAASTSGAATSSMSSSIATTTTSAAAVSSTSSAVSPNPNGKTIGLGVGLGVGLEFLPVAMMGFFMFRERKRRVQLEKQMQEVDNKLMVPGGFAGGKQQPTISTNELPNYSPGHAQEVPGGGGPRYGDC